MTTKEYLSQVRLLDVKIKNKLKELEHLREMSTSLGGFSFDEKVQTSKETGDTIGISVSKIIDLQHEINKDIEIFKKARDEIVKTIEEVGNTDYYDLLYQRYVLYRKWEEIAVNMHKDIRWIYRLHGRALEEINTPLKAT